MIVCFFLLRNSSCYFYSEIVQLKAKPDLCTGVCFVLALQVEKLRYPKAGHTNPTVHLTVRVLTSVVPLYARLSRPTQLLDSTGYYITNVSTWWQTVWGYNLENKR